jgi:hypothetical protein
MLLRICSWHKLYKGYPFIMGIKWGYGQWGLTGGQCKGCLAIQRRNYSAYKDIAMSGVDN